MVGLIARPRRPGEAEDDPPACLIGEDADPRGQGGRAEAALGHLDRFLVGQLLTGARRGSGLDVHGVR